MLWLAKVLQTMPTYTDHPSHPNDSFFWGGFVWRMFVCLPWMRLGELLKSVSEHLGTAVWGYTCHSFEDLVRMHVRLVSSETKE